MHKRRSGNLILPITAGILLFIAALIFIFKPFEEKNPLMLNVRTQMYPAKAAKVNHPIASSTTATILPHTGSTPASSGPAYTSVPISSWLTNAGQPNKLPTLMFHYVSSKASDLAGGSNWMPTQTFEANLQALQNAGYTTVTGSDAMKILTGNQKPSNKMVWLTFDDGSLTLYRDIFPLLKKYHMHATAFIITGFVDSGKSGILNWAQIKEMQASGLVDFGSHTVSHLDLSTQAAAGATYQLQQSKARLDAELNQDTTIICYPGGGYNKDTVNIAQSLGYQFGLLDPGRSGAVAQAADSSQGLMTLDRLRMSSTTVPQTLMSMLTSSEVYNTQNTQISP